MEKHKTNVDELSEKVLKGMRIALRKLVEETARNDGSLIIGDEEGNIREVPAKDLLKDVQE